MSTHWVRCVMCGRDAACHGDSHALGSGSLCCCDQKVRGAWEPGMVEFCSAKCFVALEKGMAERRRVVVDHDLDIRPSLESLSEPT